MYFFINISKLFVTKKMYCFINIFKLFVTKKYCFINMSKVTNKGRHTEIETEGEQKKKRQIHSFHDIFIP